ncbi:hypothetical protein TWF730_005086 [Orbilia blumenaviensis]|uniref:Uncharacterized protein n=1 Tax=Orbilia blumenaviensis TaxID=1796055 RepID=A0AAV9VKJ7_9PEZI
MVPSKILAGLAVWALPACASLHGLDLEKRSLLSRHQPIVNPALHYYNATGRDPTGRVKGHKPGDRHDGFPDYGWLKDVLSNYTMMEGPLEKRHTLGDGKPHQETLIAGVNRGPMNQEFLNFLKQIISDVTPTATGKILIEPGCRPLFYGCPPNDGFDKSPDSPAEYLEFCNYESESRTFEITELLEKLFVMSIQKLWELLGNQRYKLARVEFKVDSEKWEKYEHSTYIKYPSIRTLSPFILLYSWETNDPMTGLALYDTPPAVKDQELLKNVWKLDCGKFANIG